MKHDVDRLGLVFFFLYKLFIYNLEIRGVRYGDF